MANAMAWEFEGRLNVIVHGAKNPSNLEWERFLADTVARRSREAGRAALPLVVLVISHGGAPDGAQRKQLTKTIERNTAPTAVLTDSALMLGVSRVIAFFNPHQRAFALNAEKAAFDFLGLSSDERTGAKRLRAKLEAELEIRS